MTRRLLWIIILLAAFLQTFSADAQCSTCTPTQKTGWTLNTFGVRYGTTGFSAADKQAIEAGMGFWNSAYPGLFTVTTSSTAEVLLEIDFGLSGTTTVAERGLTSANTGGVIRFNPDYLGTASASDFLRQVAAHEFGHAQGFNDLSGCDGQSIMNGNISESGTFMSSLSSCDTTAVSNAPAPGSGGGGGGGGGDPDNECPPQGCSPLVLDLNGDGIHTTTVQWPVLFDINGDGRAEWIAWTNPATEEAFLWLDHNGNGTVDGGRELFGIGTGLPDGRRAVDGVDALRSFDLPANGGNADGVISHEDRLWARLRLWIDSNHDGLSQAKETGPIHEYGVTVLSLTFATDAVPDSSGNVHLYRGTYLRRIVGGGPAHEGTAVLDDVFFRELQH
ncbi:MAG: hypothetical protein M3Q69_17315 [Acidobacteriota bacterium]|nr:hypothetical protein [Acidobacteriota bacterium]